MLVLASLAWTSPSWAHEFWLEPLSFNVAPGAPVAADLRNGQRFNGISLPYLPKDTARFELSHEGGKSSYSGRVGDFPAFQSEGFPSGLLVLVHETTRSSLGYASFDKFRAFAEEKGSPEVVAHHISHSLPQVDFKETYSRHVKTLIAVGSGAGTDRVFGLRTEFIAITNPYRLAKSAPMRVELHLDGQPVADRTVTLFSKAPDGTVTSQVLHTDMQGQMTFPVSPGHVYLLDSVSFARAADGDEALWETYWAALTFAVPD